MAKIERGDVIEEIDFPKKRKSNEILPSTAYTVPKKKRKICSFFQKGRCKKGEDCAFTHELLDTFPAELLPIKKVPKTLLEKLNESDVRNDRNTILQCIRYIVKNNFFMSSHDLAVKLETMSSSEEDEDELDDLHADSIKPMSSVPIKLETKSE
jgi:hypothetical protein